MDITFSSEDRKEVLKLPIVPPDLQWDRPNNNVTMETINGEIRLIGKKKLMSLSISSFFPNKEYKFARSNVKGRYAVGFFAKWKNSGKPIRMAITNDNRETLLSILVSIDNFNHGFDRAGDTTYTLDLTEYIKLKV